MMWLEIGLLWIVLSVTVPVLLGLRYTQLKKYRQRLARARTHFHRFHVDHHLPRLVR